MAKFVIPRGEGAHVRIALIAEDFYPQLGGIPEHVHHFTKELIRRGHDVTVIGSHMTGELPEDVELTYPVVRVGTSVVIYANGGVSRITVGRGLGRRLEAVFREGQFDVVHVHGAMVPTFGLVAPEAANRAGVPIVGTCHSWFPRSIGFRLFRRPLQRILDRYAAMIAVSRPVVEAMTRYFRASWEVIPNGVDVEYFNARGKSYDVARHGGPRLLYLHRLEPRNHLGTLLEAMPGILARHPTAKLLVAGDGPWRKYYHRAAARLGSSVEFLGRIENRPDHYREADLFLCPSTRAAFGITLLESMACGTPMIVADNPGFRALIDGGSEAQHLPHDDPAAWAAGVSDLLDDPERLRAMGAAGVAKAETFSWPRVTDRVYAVYERVTGGAARAVSAEEPARARRAK